MKQPDLEVAPTLNALVEKASARFEETILRSVALEGRATVALSGGSTAKALYRFMGDLSHGFLKSVPWDKIDFFLSDERYVPITDPKSNFKQAYDELLFKAKVPRKNLHSVLTDLSDPAFAADLYQEVITEFVHGGSTERAPSFDLILLGLGEDGHTASLFPGTVWSDDPKKWVETFMNHPLYGTRVSFLPQIINRAKTVMLLTSGAEKAEIVAKALHSAIYPISRIHPEGAYIWFLDQAAGAVEKAA